MAYFNNATVLTTTEKKACPAVAVKDMSLRNCWGTGIVSGYKEFVGTGLRTNFALWTSIIWMLIFFVWTNGAENDTPINDKFANNYWTLHPLYSTMQFGSETYTKTSRLCLWVTTIAIQQFIVSIFYYNSVNNSNVGKITYIVAYAFIAWGVSVPLTYLLAHPLMSIYNSHVEYARVYRGNKDVKYREYVTDQYEMGKIKLYFRFYIILLGTVILSFVASVGLIQDMEMNDHWHWLASAGGCWLFDMLIMDVLICLLGGVPSLLKVLRMRGYYIDYDLDVKMRYLDMD